MRSRMMGITGKRGEKSGIGGRTRTMAGASLTDLLYKFSLHTQQQPYKSVQQFVPRGKVFVSRLATCRGVLGGGVLDWL